MEISLCRVSSDSKYIDLICRLPKDYTFSVVHLRVRYFVDRDWVTKEFDLSEDFRNKQNKRGVYRIKLEEFGIKVPAIYLILFEARSLISDPESDMPIFTDTAYCSDVNLVYQSMLDDILSMGDACAAISDDAIRKYLMLYGHQSALYANAEEEAEMLFKILVKQFSKCGGSKRPGNCGYQINPNYIKSNCGCKQ